MKTSIPPVTAGLLPGQIEFVAVPLRRTRGIPEQWSHPRFLAACETIFRRARSAGVGAGIHFWGSVADGARFLSLGANMLIHSADITLFQKHLRLELEAIRDAAGFQQAIPTAASTPI